jgi:hypothetical protein
MTKKYTDLLSLVDKAKSTAIKRNLPKDWHYYKVLRNKSQNVKTKLKLESFNEQMSKTNSNQSKFAWKVFNDEIGKRKTLNSITKLIVNESEITSEKEKQFPIPEHTSTMECTSITTEEVLKVIKHLKPNKPIGSDGIPAKFYKPFSDELTPILTKLFNESLRLGKMPAILKKSYIECLYKGKGTRTACNNFRPISIISATSKLFEHIMYTRLSSYLESTELLSDNQHGYRRNRSNQSAVLYLTSQIRKAADSKLIRGLVFVDFQKAFDSINQDILIRYLASLGVVASNIKWLESYFINRQISVQNGQYESEPRILSRGIPQGSSLSGLLFSLCINMLLEKFKNCKVILYADDLVLWFSSTSVNEVKEHLQEDLNDLQLWCESNDMTINVPKTKCMIITPPRIKTPQLDILVSTQRVEQVKSFKYLGVVIDDHLTWNEQYEEVCDKVSQLVYLINRHKKGISQKWLHIFCTAIVLSTLDYCYAACGNLPTTKYKRIDLILLRAANLIVENSTLQLIDIFDNF